MNVTSNNNQAQARDFVTSFAKKEKKGAKKPDYQNVGRLSTERTNIEEPPTLKKTNTTYRESTHLQRENMLRDPSSNQRDQMDPVHKSEPKHHEHSQAYNQAYKQLSKVLKLQTEHSQEEINEQKERADRYKKKVESYKKQSKQFQLTIDSNNAKFDEFEKKLAKEKDRQDGEKKQLEDKWAESLQQVERLKAQLEEVRQQQGRHVA
jgi:chromosome segregation ATPase